MLTGQPLSSFHQDQQKRSWQGPILSLALIPQDRAQLHRSIELRFKKMIEQGLENELRDLRNRFQLFAELPSMRCVGYRQMWQYLEGEYDFNKMMESGIYATRQLAKRQLTWLRSWSNLQSFDPYQIATEDNLFQLVRDFVNRHY
jgi:tRNA dimethylallyltransferase